MRPSLHGDHAPRTVISHGHSPCLLLRGLMCAEKEPLECHRTILVARHLETLGLEVRHILGDGRLESHADAMTRLVRELHLPEGDMFSSREDVVAEA
jgi:hypothetical protein